MFDTIQLEPRVGTNSESKAEAIQFDGDMLGNLTLFHDVSLGQ